MKRKIFCSFYYISNIFSTDEKYITFTEPNKVQIILEDVYKCYGSPKDFKLLKEDINKKELTNINNLKNFDMLSHERDEKGEYKWVPSNDFNYDLG